MRAPVITQPVVTFIGGKQGEQQLLRRLEDSYSHFRRLQRDFQTLHQQTLQSGESQGDLQSVQKALRDAHAKYQQLQDRYEMIRRRQQFARERSDRFQQVPAATMTLPATSVYTAMAEPAALSFSAEFAKGIFVDLYV